MPVWVWDWGLGLKFNPKCVCSGANPTLDYCGVGDLVSIFLVRVFGVKETSKSV